MNHGSPFAAEAKRPCPRVAAVGAETPLVLVILFHKPCGVLSQFKPVEGKRTLLEFPALAGGRAVGRLDEDSEGLLVVTRWPWVQTLLTRPGRLEKIYWAQVEGLPTESTLRAWQRGIVVGDYTTAPARARRLDDPQLSPRIPPIRHRLNVPTSWLELALREGKNRQVRRMTAALGHPTLRLVRVAVGQLRLGSLGMGEARPAGPAELDWLQKLR